MIRNDKRLLQLQCNFIYSLLIFPVAHGKSRTKRDQEPRSPGETNWYSAFEVWACVWAIGNMHWASTQLKLNYYLINLYVTFTRSKNYARRDL